MIHSKFLNPSIIQKIYTDSKWCNPVKFFIWEDFIDPEIYKKIEEEIQSQDCNIADVHKDVGWHRLNKTVLLEWEYLQKVFDFFQSKTFEKYLSIFLKMPIKQEFYVDTQEISNMLGKDFTGAVTQIYQKWDFFDWHIDWPLDKWSQGAFTYYLGWYKWEWKKENGWNLELWMESHPGSPIIEPYHTIEYKKNTLVFICGSSIAYHRVTPLLEDVLRLSIQSTIFKD